MSDHEIVADLAPLANNEQSMVPFRSELPKIVDELKLQILEQQSLNETLLNADLNIKSLVQQFSDKDNKLGEAIATNNKALSKTIADLNLIVGRFAKLPEDFEQKMITIAPKIAEQIIEKHTDCVQEFKNNINQCNHTLGTLKQNTIKIQRWHAKRVAIICVAATIIAMVASGSSTYFILQKYPPSHETRVLKANNVTATEKVYIFDVTGKFCGKAKIELSR